MSKKRIIKSNKNYFPKGRYESVMANLRWYAKEYNTTLVEALEAFDEPLVGDSRERGAYLQILDDVKFLDGLRGQS